MDGATLARYQEDVGETCGEPTRIQLDDLALVMTPDGPLLAAVLTGDGLLLRDVNGTWRLRSTEEAAEAPTSGRERRGRFRSVEPELQLPGQLPGQSPTPTPSPTRPPVCASPSYRTVTPDPRNGPPTSYPVCPV